MNTEINLFTDEIMKEMGKRIQKARKEKKIKAIVFADMIGVGKDQLSRIENGRVPCKVEYLFTIGQYLEVSTDYLLYGKKDVEATKERLFEKIKTLEIADLKKVEAIMEIIKK